MRRYFLWLGVAAVTLAVMLTVASRDPVRSATVTNATNTTTFSTSTRTIYHTTQQQVSVTNYQSAAPGVAASTSSISVTNAPTATATNVSFSTTTYIGPQTIMIGDNQSQPFTIAPGAEDIDTLITSDVYQIIFTNTTTTETTAASN